MLFRPANYNTFFGQDLKIAIAGGIGEMKVHPMSEPVIYHTQLNRSTMSMTINAVTLN